MAKVYDVPSDVLISRLAAILKNEDIPAPSWIPFVKTGAHADKPPQDRDWWHTRCASLMRKIYLHGPLGINELRKIYGGGRPSGYGAAHHKDAGGAIIRNAIQGLEKLGYVEKVEKKGRVISKKGMQKLDRLSTEILNELIVVNPQLKIYS
ncbi:MULTISPECIES: 30S ribosomal protein S19e [Nitrosarchaeum]|jgi:small subunit ribosomal protein S19e|uniref:Small ribosomal subunit protein eS19 n=1 Tax=Nitrosarchaeum koreense MY1 TaxID=1001994 RepID=F9CZA4_9ARCH|nr:MULTISPECIES: 30S ribosomal protein S19e [Nitrosarchaeum]EGP94493.1 Ribosomal protein S19e [Nitrosarchaeum koreense MY1]MBS3925453.1 30S ribosomal protein S19e [Nitrosarchaeum sp.]MCV0412427.1 30S ribosomal protein S19e [Nitrosarchaeum sp.]QLH11626.1 30S ribosomal protein S19e [Nitrosarchaeum sp. AC2]HXW03157.1 30S ribosomal protein S19e [Nitrosarchaeum sp.]